ncbi:hypothetical protein PSN01_04887 [Micromonospora saelicesensis]|nr:hypothetical protein PSN01_04887 [Micromonospora saelicesensis]
MYRRPPSLTRFPYTTPSRFPQHLGRAWRQLVLLGQQPQRLRVAGEQVGDVPGQREDPSQPTGDRAAVAQQPQVPGGAAQLVGDLSVVEQPPVRLRRVGELAEQHRQQGALDGRRAAHPAGERLEVAQRPGRVGEAEDLQAVPGRLRGEPQPVRRHPGHRLQQRPVEQFGVQSAYLGGVGDPLGPEALHGAAPRRGRETQCGGEPAQPARLGGHCVRTTQALELQPVLDAAQEAVAAQQGLAVGPTDVAAGDERPQRRDGSWRAQRLITATVHELQQLDGELDVAQPARTALDLALQLLRRDVVDDPAAHGADVLDRLGPLGRPPDQRRELVDPLLGQRQVTGGRAGLE